ncbi:MAG TPA: multiheme c-type cytochrome, partial [Anaerolineae bacterium]|nr:multiheme c-type cytochrome [Anaerolineae bacterium]
YRVTVNGAITGSLVNQAQITGPALNPVTLSHALLVPRPILSTTLTDFFFPGTQPNQLVNSIPNPAECDVCHTAPIYDSWRGSMMSQSGRDPLMWAALAVANQDAGSAGDYCLRCHTPKGWFEGCSPPANGFAVQAEDIHAGVACEICHRMVDPVASTSDQAVSIDAGIRSSLTPTFTLPSGHVGSAMLIVDPLDRRRGPFTLTAPHTALRTDFLGQAANAVTESRLCGSCHNLDNPALSWDGSRYWPNGTNLAAPSFNKGDLFPIERTYDEWLNSQYASGGVYAPLFAGAKPNGIVGSCQDCHLRRTVGKAAEDAYNPVNRDCVSTGCLPEHDLAGGNTWAPLILQDTRWRLNSAGEAAYLNNTIIRAREMLKNAATLSVTLTTSNTTKIALVRVTNQTGHKLPTGYPEGRRIWLNLKAYDANDNLVYESGAYNPATGVLTQDPAIKIYEAKHGLSQQLANLLNLPVGESFHFVLNNIILKDNRIPPRGFTQSALNQRGMAPVGATYVAGQYWDDTVYLLPPQTERVTASLYYQTASKEYIDFLRATGGLDGATLGTLWDTSKSPPELMTVAWDPSLPAYLPLIYKLSN